MERVETKAFFYPLLEVLAASPNGLKRADAIEKTAEVAGLTDAQRAERLPQTNVLRYRHRMGWACHCLKSASLIESAGRGFWKITDLGRAFLGEHPNGITEAEQNVLSRAGVRTLKRDDPQEEAASPATPYEDASPEERIEEALAELNTKLSAELLEQIGAASPAFFEKLVLDLLLKMGYGATAESLQLTGAGGDGGIDGIITLDRLGLEKVYVQAKRWKQNVGRPEIQAFYGALAGRRATRGVFITIARFSREARDYAEQVSDSLVLVDGPRLATLMIEFEVGIDTGQIFRVSKLDSDYFDEG